MDTFCLLQLTCRDAGEASKISERLLTLKLIACAKQLPVGSDFLWKGEVDHNDEILLLMESKESLFDTIETEITKLHSYETFVFTALPFSQVSSGAKKWLSESLSV